MRDLLFCVVVDILSVGVQRALPLDPFTRRRSLVAPVHTAMPAQGYIQYCMANGACRRAQATTFSRVGHVPTTHPVPKVLPMAMPLSGAIIQSYL